MSRDGTDLRLLVVVDDDGRLHGLDRPVAETLVDLTACSAGIVVPDPEVNQGLVRDCEALLRARDQLAGRAELDWDEQLAIAGWEGVTVGGSPPRVHKLRLPGGGLDGVLPPELGGLSELRILDLDRNQLSGGIPPELGSLEKLERLRLFVNFLSGPVPPELGQLPELQSLNLSNNYLSGSLPPELGGLSGLKALGIRDNWLSGRIPPELGGLLSLGWLDLAFNRLSGSIPEEMTGLASLTALHIYGNDLSGCVPGQLPEIWVEASGLERCGPEEGPGQ